MPILPSARDTLAVFPRLTLHPENTETSNRLMKKLFTILTATLCLTLGAAAQTKYRVASTATSLSDLTSGTYLIRVLSNKNLSGKNGSTDNNGRFLYADGTSAHTDAGSNTSNNFEGTTISATDKANYLWQVTKNSDGTYNIQLLNNASRKWVLNYQSFSLASSAGSTETVNLTGTVSTLSSYSGWIYFKGTTKYRSGFSWKNATSYVGHSGSLTLEGWNYSQDCDDVAHFKFFAATDASSHTVTYDFYLDGAKKMSKEYTVQDGAAYPEYGDIFPDYVTGSAVPTGTVTDDVTADIQCTYNGPVTAGKPYFIHFAFPYATYSTADDVSGRYGYLSENNGGALAAGTHSKNLASKKGVWVFSGNQFDGWTVTSADNDYRWYAPQGLTGAATDRIMTRSLIASTGYESFVLRAPQKDSDIKTGGGFAMQVKDHDTWFVNSRDGYVGFWVTDFGNVDGDPGSGIKVEDALPAITLNSADNTDYYATYYLPFAAKVPEGFKAYAVTRGDNATALLEEFDGVIPANTGALVKGSSSSATFTLAESEGTSLANILTGTLTDKTDFTADGVYVFSKRGTTVGFYHPAASTTKLAANKAYVVATSSDADVDGYAVNPGFTPTGIGTAASAAAQDAKAALYDLSGRRVASPVKGGVYIQGGRKVVIR